MQEDNASPQEKKLIANAVGWAAKKSVNDAQFTLGSGNGVAWAKTVRMPKIGKDAYIQELSQTIMGDDSLKFHALLAYEKAGYPGETAESRAFFKVQAIKAMAEVPAQPVLTPEEISRQRGTIENVKALGHGLTLAAEHAEMQPDKIAQWAAKFAARGVIELGKGDNDNVAWARLAKDNMGDPKYVERLAETISKDKALMAQARAYYMDRREIEKNATQNPHQPPVKGIGR